MPLTLQPDGVSRKVQSRGFSLGKRAGLHRRLRLAAQSKWHWWQPAVGSMLAPTGRATFRLMLAAPWASRANPPRARESTAVVPRRSRSRTLRRLLGFARFLADDRHEFADPDIPKPHRIAVKLEADGEPLRMPLVRGRLVPGRGAGQFEVVLDRQPVVQHRQRGGLLDAAVFGEAGARKMMSNVCHSPGGRQALTMGGDCL